MHVILIADYAIAEGGAPQVAIASARGLADLGHKVTYVHGVGSDADAALDSHPNIDRIALDGQDVWSKNIVKGARDGVWNSGHKQRLLDILGKFERGAASFTSTSGRSSSHQASSLSCARRNCPLL